MKFPYPPQHHTSQKLLPYSPAFTGMHSYTKPPIFKNGQVVSYITACGTFFRDCGMSYYMEPCLTWYLWKTPVNGPPSSVRYHVYMFNDSKLNNRPKSSNLDQLGHDFLRGSWVKNIRIWGFCLSACHWYEMYSFFVIIFYDNLDSVKLHAEIRRFRTLRHTGE